MWSLERVFPVHMCQAVPMLEPPLYSILNMFSCCTNISSTNWIHLASLSIQMNPPGICWRDPVILIIFWKCCHQRFWSTKLQFFWQMAKHLVCSMLKRCSKNKPRVFQFVLWLDSHVEITVWQCNDGNFLDILYSFSFKLSTDTQKDTQRGKDIKKPASFSIHHIVTPDKGWKWMDSFEWNDCYFHHSWS